MPCLGVTLRSGPEGPQLETKISCHFFLHVLAGDDFPSLCSVL